MPSFSLSWFSSVARAIPSYVRRSQQVGPCMLALPDGVRACLFRSRRPARTRTARAEDGTSYEGSGLVLVGRIRGRGQLGEVRAQRGPGIRRGENVSFRVDRERREGQAEALLDVLYQPVLLPIGVR